MKRWLFIFMVVALSMLTVSPVLAHEDMGCAHDVATIASLRECVVHAREMGHIDSNGVARSSAHKSRQSTSQSRSRQGGQRD